MCGFHTKVHQSIYHLCMHRYIHFWCPIPGMENGPKQWPQIMISSFGYTFMFSIIRNPLFGAILHTRDRTLKMYANL